MLEISRAIALYGASEEAGREGAGPPDRRTSERCTIGKSMVFRLGLLSELLSNAERATGRPLFRLQLVETIGAVDQSRTGDLLITNQLLCQLSYNGL